MKVVYKPNREYARYKHTIDLTPNKIYEVIGEYKHNYFIINDGNSKSFYDKVQFITLEKYRENLIEEIIKWK